VNARRAPGCERRFSQRGGFHRPRSRAQRNQPRPGVARGV